MDGQISGTTEAAQDAAAADPWIAAFAALEPKNKEGAEAAASGDGSGADNADAAGTDGKDEADAQVGDGNGSEEGSGGLGDAAAEPGVEDAGGAFDGFGDVDEEALKKFEEDRMEEIRDRAIREIADEFIKRGVRHQNGVLGATLDDEDICKRDEDGVPRFYNPETGREFTGDNPRRQAQEWIDDYNRELARVFNASAEQHEQNLRKDIEPSLAVMRFAPKYGKLDEVRRGMFDNIIEAYEIKDSEGNLVGYSCDLDRALETVERQIEVIQSYAKQHQAAPQEALAKADGPALDMKTSSGAVPSGEQAAPASLEEAMERIQDAQISKLKGE